MAQEAYSRRGRPHVRGQLNEQRHCLLGHNPLENKFQDVSRRLRAARMVHANSPLGLLTAHRDLCIAKVLDLRNRLCHNATSRDIVRPA